MLNSEWLCSVESSEVDKINSNSLCLNPRNVVVVEALNRPDGSSAR